MIQNCDARVVLQMSLNMMTCLESAVKGLMQRLVVWEAGLSGQLFKGCEIFGTARPRIQFCFVFRIQSEDAHLRSIHQAQVYARC